MLASAPSSPVYSNLPAADEIRLSSSPLENRRMPTSYTYTTKRLTLDLGPRLPGGTQAPSYGLGGVIEGFAILHTLSHVEKVELTVSKFFGLGSVLGALINAVCRLRVTLQPWPASVAFLHLLSPNHYYPMLSPFITLHLVPQHPRPSSLEHPRFHLVRVSVPPLPA
jgi:hypothetical protein